MRVTTSWVRIKPTKSDRIGHRTVITKTFRMPNGNAQTFETIGLENSHCVATIALTLENKVILAEQFRPGPEKIFEELPGGGVEASDSSYEAAARRELLEETGYKAGVMQHIGDVFKDAYHNSTWHFFLATACQPSTYGQHLDPDEYAAVKYVSIDQLLENARYGRMTDVSAIFLAYDRLVKLKEMKI